MINILNEYLTDYFNTLENTGYVSNKDVYNILMLDFLKDLIYNPDFLLVATLQLLDFANDLYNCIIEKKY